MMPSFFRLITLVFAFCLACATQLSAQEQPSGLNAFTIGPGDVLELTIVGETNPSITVRVDELGYSLVPLLGQISLKDLTFEEAVKLLKDSYITENFLSDPQISITLREGRPYIVAGDVKNPGAYPSRPNLTVEEAIALAGGHRVAGVFNPVDFNQERILERMTSNWTDIFEAELGIARRRAEIAGDDVIAMPSFDGTPLPSAYIETRLSDETSILVRSNSLFKREISDLLEMQKIAEQEVVDIATLRERIDETVEQLRLAVEQEKDLLDRGLQTRNNFLEASQRLENAITGLGSQALTAGQAKRRLVEIRSNLDNFEANRKAQLTEEIGSLSARIPPRRAALAALSAETKLALSLSSSGSNDLVKQTLQIRRGEPGAKEAIMATPDMQVLPGDVLAVLVEFSFDAR